MKDFLLNVWNNLVASFPSILRHLAALAILLVLFWIFSRILTVLLKPLYRRTGVDGVLRKYINRAVKATVWLIAAVIVMDMLGIPVGSALTVLAAAGAALALALKESLSNLAAGLILLFHRPFKENDALEVDGFAGVVKEIHLLHTYLVTATNTRISIPNNTMMTAVIVNNTAFETRRLDLSVSVSYNTDLAQVRALLLDMVKDDERILPDPAPTVLLKEQADSAVILQLRLWCPIEQYWALHFELTEKTQQILVENHIEIPYPQLDVHITK